MVKANNILKNNYVCLRMRERLGIDDVKPGDSADKIRGIDDSSS